MEPLLVVVGCGLTAQAKTLVRYFACIVVLSVMGGEPPVSSMCGAPSGPRLGPSNFRLGGAAGQVEPGVTSSSSQLSASSMVCPRR